MEQYFEAGEEIILDSPNNPHLNGDCVVVEVSTRRSFSASEGKYYNGRPHYKLTIQHPTAAWWSQSSLRKKHKPGDSFESLMTSLNKEKVSEQG